MDITITRKQARELAVMNTEQFHVICRRLGLQAGRKNAKTPATFSMQQALALGACAAVRGSTGIQDGLAVARVILGMPATTMQQAFDEGRSCVVLQDGRVWPFLVHKSSFAFGENRALVEQAEAAGMIQSMQLIDLSRLYHKLLDDVNRRLDERIAAMERN